MDELLTTEGTMRVYIAGPMRGVRLYNHPAFDEAAENLRACGEDPVSPSEMDRAIGFDPHSLPESWDWNNLPPDFDARECRLRCIKTLESCDGIYMLEGWRQSLGALTEHAYAHWKGMVILYQEANQPAVDSKGTSHRPEDIDSILTEAYNLVHGDRQKDYGHPRDDFLRTAKMWEGILGVKVEPFQVALCMIMVKTSRLIETPHKRDSWVDIAGYAEAGQMCCSE